MEWPYFLLFLFIICCQWCKISTLHVWMNEHFSLGSLLSYNSNFSFDKNENCNFVNPQWYKPMFIAWHCDIQVMLRNKPILDLMFAFLLVAYSLSRRGFCKWMFVKYIYNFFSLLVLSLLLLSLHFSKLYIAEARPIENAKSCVFFSGSYILLTQDLEKML